MVPETQEKFNGLAHHSGITLAATRSEQRAEKSRTNDLAG
jgi:hypothetical protein